MIQSMTEGIIGVAAVSSRMTGSTSWNSLPVSVRLLSRLYHCAPNVKLTSFKLLILCLTVWSSDYGFVLVCRRLIHSFIYSFIHSFIPAISIAPPQVLYYSEALPTTARIGVSRRSAQATAGKGLAQGAYVAARAGVEPTTLRLRVIASTKAPPCPNSFHFNC